MEKNGIVSVCARLILIMSACGCHLSAVHAEVLNTPRVYIEPLQGSTGDTATVVLDQDLRQSNVIALTAQETAAFTVRGVANGGTIEGVVVDREGREILKNQYNDPNLKQATHLFADDVVFVLTQRPGIASSRIAFVSDVSGEKQIYLTDVQGTQVRQLTRSAGAKVRPSLSRDGAALTYVVRSRGQSTIWFLDLIQGGTREVTPGATGLNSGAMLSPDARWLALSTSDTRGVQMSLVEASGGTPTAITEVDGMISSPAWHPSGGEAAFSLLKNNGQATLAIYDLENGKWREISSTFSHVTAPDWSPDGQMIAFVARLDGRSHLAICRPDGTEAHVIGLGTEPSWGANSRHLVYTTGSQLIILDTLTQSRRVIVSGKGRISEPSWTR